MKNQSITDLLAWAFIVAIIILVAFTIFGCGTSKGISKEPIGAYHVKDANTH